MTHPPAAPEWHVAAFYRFAPVADPASLRDRLRTACEAAGTRGTILVAPEGVNGTIAGSKAGIENILTAIRAEPGFGQLEPKFSTASSQPFHRMKVRLKAEIVTMRVPGLDPAREAGTYVAPEDWNALIAAPDTVVIDTRNTYEVAIGQFSGAVDPGTDSFSEFPAWVEQNRDRLEGKAIAMYCTGGIRCEKATAYMLSLGFDRVHHLEGGILRYLETVPADQSLWQGECFVFDERVGVGHGLEEGAATLCRACRHPLTPEETVAPEFVDGVSCKYCFDSRSEADRERFRERQKQVELAHQRGSGPHIGR